jgi:hypothetical protein
MLPSRRPFTGSDDAYWPDPKGSGFGPAAAYLGHDDDLDVGEAVKLLAAVGYSSSNLVRVCPQCRRNH